MTPQIKKLADKISITMCGDDGEELTDALIGDQIEKFAQLVVEETLKQVDERTYCRGETSWYDDDKDWVRLHFGYGELYNATL